MDICHRDIKPDNVLIDRHGRPKLCDFGFACKKTDSEAAFVCGSLPYMSPELLAGTNFDPFASDVWALGITYYFMAVGHLPWSHREPEFLVPEIVTKEIEMPSDLPEAFTYIVNRMLQRTPMKRPTMAQVEKLGFFNDRAHAASAGSAHGLPPMVPRSHTLRSRTGAGMSLLMPTRSLAGNGILLPGTMKPCRSRHGIAASPSRMLNLGFHMSNADVRARTDSVPAD
jgi:serine/threonine protein kinase